MFAILCHQTTYAPYLNFSCISYVNLYNIMIMIKDKVITLLIALMCVSPISGSFTVICYGSDGHIAIETILHGHCDCPESDENGRQRDSNGSLILFSSDHSHCKDILAASSVVISVRKNIKPQLAKLFVQGLYQKSISNHMTSSFRHPLLWNTELSSFFTPLRTIILLA